MNDSKPRTLPCDVSVNKFDNKDSKLLSSPKLYQEIVGSLIYLMTCTRPDLSFVVSKLSQYMNQPTEAHLNLAKNVLRYLKGTKDQKLCFSRSQHPLTVIGFCDSDWAGSEDRKSISGYGFKLCQDGPLISWKSKKQSIVSLSSCEAEYTALTYAIQEGRFISQIFADLSDSEREIFSLYVDNQAAINLGNNPIYHQRSKHIDVKYHYIRNEIKEKNVQLLYVPSDENIADIFTKPVNGLKLKYFNLFSD